MSITAQLLNPVRIDFPYADRVVEQAAAPASFWQPVLTLFRHAAHALVRHKAVVHYISDNGNYADVARGEIVTRLQDARALLETISGRPGPHFEYYDIPSMDTNAAAFDLAQLSRGAVRGFGNIYFVNCAPRKKQRGNAKKNGGEKIYAGILPNGALIAGTGEEAFVHFKDLVAAGQLNIYQLNVATDGTQFRSRDYFPWLAIVLGNYINRRNVNRLWNKGLSLQQRDQILFGLKLVDQKTKLGAAEIPDLQTKGVFVARADTHGNLKLGVTHAEIVAHFGKQDNPEVIVVANSRILPATIATNSFDKPAGITVISAGSSGQWPDVNGHKRPPFAEIFTVGGRARHSLRIGNGELKDGVDVHFVPTPLFNAAQDQLLASGVAIEDTALANILVATGLVKGLDHTPLQQTMEQDTLVSVLRPALPYQGAVRHLNPGTAKKDVSVLARA